MLSILGSHCGGALRPPPHPIPPLFTLHPFVHPSPPAIIYRPSIHPPIKQASNQQTKQPKPRNPIFPKCCRYLACIAGKALRPPPHSLPPLFTQHPSIHPSIHPSFLPSTKHTNGKLHIHQALYHASNHGKQTKQPTRQKVTFLSLSMIYPSRMCFLQIQATNKPSRPNQPTH